MSRDLSEHPHPSAKALFISPDGTLFPDTMICSGLIPDQLGGQPCPFSNNGRLPDLIPLHADDPAYTADKGAPGDLCPPGAKQQLGPLEH